VPLAKVLPIEMAGKVFLCGLFGMTIYVGARLNRALTGKWTWLALVPALLIYNRILAYGFINYLCGLGLLLLAFGIHIENRTANPWKRLALESLFLCGLFACHLVSMALYLACVFAYDFGQWLQVRPTRQAIVKDIAILFAPTAALVFAFLKFSPTTDEAVQMEFRDWLSKSKLLHMSFQSGQGIWDLIFAFLVLVFLVWVLSYRKIRLDRSMIWPVAALLVIFIASPTGFKQAMNVDTRIPLALTYVFFAGLVPTLNFSPSTFAACLLGLLGFRSATTSIHFAEWNRAVQSVLSDLRRVPSGSIVFVTRNVDSHAFDSVQWDPAILHLDCLLLLERPIVAQDFFAIPSQQPILKKPPYDGLDLSAKVGGYITHDFKEYAEQASSLANDPDLQGRPAYVYYIKAPTDHQTPPEFVPIVVRDKYAIYRVKPKPAAKRKMKAPMTIKHQGEEIERWNSSN